MALDGTKWQIQVDKSIRYIGGDHTTASANYITVLELHRWLQDLADDASSLVTLTNCSITSLSTVSPGRWETVAGAVTKNACVFTSMDTFIYASSDVLTDCTWNLCNSVTTGGATFSGCAFASLSGASAVLASSPANAAKVSNSSFTSDGTGNGLEVGGTAADFTLTNVTFTGYSGTSTDAAVYVNTSAGSVKITIDGGTDITGNVRAAAGVTVTVEVGARAVKMVVVDVDGAAVTGSNVFLRASASGVFPYKAGVTITRATTLATVAHAAHGLKTDDKVFIEGITDKTEDNGVHTITYIDAGSYSYATDDSGSTSYLGTITSTFTFLKGDANQGAGSNELSMSRSISGTQPVVGWARKGTSAPYYKTGPVSGDVVSTGNTSFTAVMISDD